jgi:hypothetical protein
MMISQTFKGQESKGRWEDRECHICKVSKLDLHTVLGSTETIERR